MYKNNRAVQLCLRLHHFSFKGVAPLWSVPQCHALLLLYFTVVKKPPLPYSALHRSCTSNKVFSSHLTECSD